MYKPKLMQLVLASSSLGRKKILSFLKIPFTVIPSTVDEEKIFGKTPLEALKLRAKAKGENIDETNYGFISILSSDYGSQKPMSQDGQNNLPV